MAQCGEAEELVGVEVEGPQEDEGALEVTVVGVELAVAEEVASALAAAVGVEMRTLHGLLEDSEDGDRNTVHGVAAFGLGAGMLHTYSCRPRCGSRNVPGVPDGHGIVFHRVYKTKAFCRSAH